MAAILPKTIKAQVDNHGRIVIPAVLREELDMQSGTELVLTVVDGRLQLENLRHAIRRHAGIAKRMRPDIDGSKVIDELIAERRAWARYE